MEEARMTTGSDYLGSGVIEDVVLAKEWTLSNVLNMDESIEEVVEILIKSMDIRTKYSIVKDVEYIGEYQDHTVGEIISYMLRHELTTMVSFVVNRYLKTARVNFSDRQIEERVEDVESKVERPEDSANKNEKVVTLKDRIKQDTKQLSTNDMKKKGMI